jgi:NAD(P)-dependent dehydrogenase (short-subunit alcohol dehydrogenase family)
MLKPIPDGTIEDLAAVYRVNVHAVFDLTARIRSAMTAGGSIVNLSSSSAMLASTTEAAAYASTKAAVLSLTRSFAYAFAAQNVRVNAVCPWIIDTPMQDAVLAKVAAARGIPEAELVDARNATVPLKRAASADECAATIWFLLSPESSYITDQAIDEQHDAAICGFHTGCGLIIRRLKKKGPKNGPNCGFATHRFPFAAPKSVALQKV